MPSKCHRINLTVPDDVYDRLLNLQLKHRSLRLSTLCLCLIEQRLDDLAASYFYGGDRK